MNCKAFLNFIKTINLQFKKFNKPKHRKHKKLHTRQIIIKLLKTNSDKKEVLKSSQFKKENTYFKTKNNKSDSRFPVRNNVTGKTLEQYIQSTERENKPIYTRCYLEKYLKNGPLRFFSPGDSN